MTFHYETSTGSITYAVTSESSSLQFLIGDQKYLPPRQPPPTDAIWHTASLEYPYAEEHFLNQKNGEGSKHPKKSEVHSPPPPVLLDMNHHAQIMDDDGADHAVRAVPGGAVPVVQTDPEKTDPDGMDLGNAVPGSAVPDGVVHAGPEEVVVDQTNPVRRLMPTERT